MRRKDREITDLGDIAGILARCPVCTLSLAAGGEPYGVAMSFGYQFDEKGALSLFFHSAAEGHKLDMLRQNPRAAFCMFGEPELHDRGTGPCGFTAAYESVAGVGTVRFVEEPAEKRAALDIFMHHYGMVGAGDYDSGSFARVAVLRLDAEHFTAKRSRGAQ